MRILLSAGHGGKDVGSIGADKDYEKVRTLELANLVASKLKQVGHNVTVIQEKNSNGNWSLKNRSGYDYALSIHFNAFNGAATGVECLYKNKDGKATELSKQVASVLGLKNRGAKKRTDLYMLNTGFDNLIEVCFHDNKGDLEAYNGRKNEVATIIAEVINGGYIAPKPASKSVTEIAKEVIAGKWGNQGDKPSRQTRLEQAGYNYSEVRAEVNRLLGTKTTPKVNYYPKYKGSSSSLVDALKSIGVNSGFSNRKAIAKKNGINLYVGTAKQNTTLLNLLKQGKLKK